VTAEHYGVLLPYVVLLVLYVVAHRARVRHRAGLARLAAYDARLRRDADATRSSMERSRHRLAA
jgi:hypothetical protein